MFRSVNAASGSLRARSCMMQCCFTQLLDSHMCLSTAHVLHPAVHAQATGLSDTQPASAGAEQRMHVLMLYALSSASQVTPSNRLVPW